MTRSKPLNHGYGDERTAWRRGDMVVELGAVGSLRKSHSLKFLTLSPCPWPLEVHSAPPKLYIWEINKYITGRDCQLSIDLTNIRVSISRPLFNLKAKNVNWQYICKRQFNLMSIDSAA